MGLYYDQFAYTIHYIVKRRTWSCSVGVITLGSDPSNAGSIPARTFIFIYFLDLFGTFEISPIVHLLASRLDQYLNSSLVTKSDLAFYVVCDRMSWHELYTTGRKMRV